MSFVSVSAGQIIRATHVQQFTAWLTGQKLDTPGTIAATSTTDYALTVRSEDGATGLALDVQYGAGTSPTSIARFNKAGVTFNVPAVFSSSVNLSSASMSGTFLALGGTSADVDYGGNRGGLEVYDDGSVGIGAADKNSSNVFTVYNLDTSGRVHTALFDLAMVTSFTNADTATVKMISRSGQVQGELVGGVRGNQLTTLDLEGIWGTNASIGLASGGGRHVLSAGIATQHARYDATGAYADEANVIYSMSQGTGPDGSGKFNSGTGAAVRANAWAYVGGPQGYEWLLYYVDVGGNKVTDALFVVNQYGYLGIKCIPSAPITIKQPANTNGGGIVLTQTGGTNYSALYTGGDNKTYIQPITSGTAAGYLTISNAISATVVEIVGGSGITAPLLSMSNTSTVLLVDAAGAIDYRNSANYGTGSAGTVASLGNISTNAAIGPTTQARVAWAKLLLNGSTYWMPLWQ